MDPGNDPAKNATDITSRADVVIIGAGLAGSVAASTLVQAEADVVLIDAAAVVPPSLRAERLGTDILALFACFAGNTRASTLQSMLA